MYWREIWILLLDHKGNLGLKPAIEHDTWSCKGNTDKYAEKHTVLLPFATNEAQDSSPEEHMKKVEPYRYGSSTLWAV